MRKPRTHRQPRRPSAEVVFKALLAVIQRRFGTSSKTKSGRLLGLHAPMVTNYQRSAPVLQSTWEKWFGRFLDLGVKFGQQDAKRDANTRLLEAVASVYGIGTQMRIARKYGVTQQAVASWRAGRASPTTRQLKRLLRSGTDLRISPIMELRSIQPHRRRVTWSLSAKKDERAALKSKLEGRKVLYALYDSRGSALYVGQTQKSLYSEVEQRLSAKMRSKLLTAGLSKHQLHVGDVARFLSAYEVLGSKAINDLEALLIRTMANDLQNLHIEHFS